MPGFPSLSEYLTPLADANPQRRAVIDTVLLLAAAGVEIAALVAKGPLAGQMGAVLATHADGDQQKQLDFITNEIIINTLKKCPVAWMGSEENEDPVALAPEQPLAVNIDPLDGSSNIDTNVSIGTIFSILPNEGETPLLQPGAKQLAAGYVIYGPQTALVLTLGEGTQIFWLDQETKTFRLVKRSVSVPPVTREYAINASNFRHWDAPMQHYVIDCTAGVDGPRRADFNMRWIGSLVADAFRILARGGIYIYPGDARKGYRDGRLRLLYEANPIAMIMEQAGGAASTGTGRILDVKPHSLHQRVPLVFGSRAEVEEVVHYHTQPQSIGERSPLFAQRGLFRT